MTGKHPTDGRELRQRSGCLRSNPGEARQGATGWAPPGGVAGAPGVQQVGEG